MNETFINGKGEEVKRTRVLTYTRVMGYLSPTYRYNIGKKSEFYNRKYFDKDKAENHIYMDYGSSCGGSEHIEQAAKQAASIMVSNREFIKQYI